MVILASPNTATHSAKDNPLQGGQTLDHAVAGGVEVVAFQQLQPEPDRIGRRNVGRQQADEAFATLHHRAHDQRLEAIEVQAALGVAGGAVGPATPGLGVRLMNGLPSADSPCQVGPVSVPPITRSKYAAASLLRISCCGTNWPRLTSPI